MRNTIPIDALASTVVATPLRTFLLTGMSERSGNDAAAERGTGNAEPADADAAPPKAPTQRIENDDVIAGRPTGATAATAGAPVLVSAGPIPRGARRTASEYSGRGNHEVPGT